MIIITPTLPPHPGGVADYAALLAAHWPEPAETRSWIVAEGGTASREAFPDWSIVAVDELPGGWAEALSGVGSGTVLVNYAQYGFSRTGMPFGLVGALLKWRASEGRSAEQRRGGGSASARRWSIAGDWPWSVKRKGTDTGAHWAVEGTTTESFRADGARRLVVYFHETWLTGPWWRRRGLVAPVARRLARRLAVGADAVVTNCARHAKQLQPVVRGPVTVLPVPPNIRPAAEELTRAESRRAGPLPRRLRVVVFGLPETRLITLQGHGRFLRWLQAAGRLGELVLLGGDGRPDRFTREEAGWLGAHLPAATVRRAAALPADRISAELLAADLGLSAYAEEALGKSGTVAALWAQGCPVGFCGHSVGKSGWDFAWSVERDAPVEWAAFIEDDERRRRAGLVRREQIDAGDWTTHASRLRGFM